MQYMGGKSISAKEIASILNEQGDNDRLFISLFCGSCSIESKVKYEKKICNDKHEYLILLLQSMQNGYILPDDISREYYDDIKNNKDRDKALSGFVGFACSFGGKWFGGYAKSTKRYNYAKGSKNSLEKKMRTLQSNTTTFTNKCYRDVCIPENSIVYADPPYKGTTDYTNSKEFNHDEFWQYMRDISKHNLVFVSEINAPDDFVSIWEKPVKRDMDNVNKNIIKSTEKLFVHNSIFKKIH